MGTRTMGSQSGSSGGGQQSQVQSLARQGSLVTFPLSEAHYRLGLPLHSMNLDNHLETVPMAETNKNLSINFDESSSQYSASSSLQRQGSITTSRSLSKKTVDEVWKGIQLGKMKGEEDQDSSHERQVSVGEMTLEDFLVKAGVVVEGMAEDTKNLIGNASAVGNVAVPMAGSQDFAQEAHWLQNYQPVSMEQHMQRQNSMMGAYAPILDPVFPDSSPSLGTLSDCQTPGRKRGSSCDAEDKLVERRQKRMIKNRESAARSRARKLAYTNELENKVIGLERENERLRKQKELDEIRNAAPIPEPKYRLRRTSSALF